MPNTPIQTTLKDLENTALQLLDNIAALIKEMDAPPPSPAKRQPSIKAEVLEACRALAEGMFNSYQVHALLKGKYSKKTIFDSLRHLTMDGKLRKVGLMTYEIPAHKLKTK